MSKDNLPDKDEEKLIKWLSELDITPVFLADAIIDEKSKFDGLAKLASKECNLPFEGVMLYMVFAAEDAMKTQAIKAMNYSKWLKGNSHNERTN